jgi:hypothetical protein
VKELGFRFWGFDFLKDKRLNDNEKHILREEHLAAGTTYVRIFGGNGEVRTILDMVGLHHVMFNGKDSVAPSYPKLLRGSELPFHARIAKTADFLSAILPRFYREHGWVESFRSSIAYSLAVAGRELDPKTVACILTGTHDMSFQEATRMVELFMHPEGQEGISDYAGVKDYVCERLERHPLYLLAAEKWDREKIIGYEEATAARCREYGFPTLSQVSPLSVKHTYEDAA